MQHWSSGYGWRIMLERSWVRIPVPYTWWTFPHFFTLICCKNCIECLKRPKINEKEAGWPILLNVKPLTGRVTLVEALNGIPVLFTHLLINKHFAIVYTFCADLSVRATIFQFRKLGELYNWSLVCTSKIKLRVSFEYLLLKWTVEAVWGSTSWLCTPRPEFESPWIRPTFYSLKSL